MTEDTLVNIGLKALRKLGVKADGQAGPGAGAKRADAHGPNHLRRQIPRSHVIRKRHRAAAFRLEVLCGAWLVDGVEP